MAKRGVLLVVDYNKHILTSVQLLMGKHFEEVVRVGSNKVCVSMCDKYVPPTAILRLWFPRESSGRI